MKTYLVGGAVRDRLLGRVVKERDYVVIGSTPEEMLQKGFTPVGRAFPVFLHPKTKEEYALARKEKKTGAKHYEFSCDFSATIKLEEDLLRRDLRINAIAQDLEDEHLIDPYNGLADLKNRLLRHVSSAFVEDPLRFFRVCRFYAELADYDFVIAEETQVLMQEMAKNGDLLHLSRERVVREYLRALNSSDPTLFFKPIADCAVWDPYFVAFSGIAQNFSSYQHYYRKYLPFCSSSEERSTLHLLVLVCHFTDSVPEVSRSALSTLGLPQRYEKHTVLFLQHHALLSDPSAYSPENIYGCIKDFRALHDPEMLLQMLTYLKNTYYPKLPVLTWRHLLEQLQGINIAQIIKNLPSMEVAELVKQCYSQAIDQSVFKGKE